MMNADMSVDDAIASRRSVRAFLPKPVPRETVEEILRIASRSPSGSNIQPWHVYVVAGETRDELVREALKAFNETPEANVAEHHYYPSKWREPYLGRRRALGWGLYGLLGIERGQKDKMRAQHARNYKFFDAPIGMIFAMDRDMEHGSWTDCGMFMENVMLAARARGLHTCPQAAWMDMHTVIRRILGMPEEQIVVSGMSLGYEDETARVNELRTDRLPVDEFAVFSGF